jgi:hypothetical protein
MTAVVCNDDARQKHAKSRRIEPMPSVRHDSGRAREGTTAMQRIRSARRPFEDNS